MVDNIVSNSDDAVGTGKTVSAGCGSKRQMRISSIYAHHRASHHIGNMMSGTCSLLPFNTVSNSPVKFGYLIPEYFSLFVGEDYPQFNLLSGNKSEISAENNNKRPTIVNNSVKNIQITHKSPVLNYIQKKTQWHKEKSQLNIVDNFSKTIKDIYNGTNTNNLSAYKTIKDIYNGTDTNNLSTYKTIKDIYNGTDTNNLSTHMTIKDIYNGSDTNNLSAYNRLLALQNRQSQYITPVTRADDHKNISQNTVSAKRQRTTINNIDNKANNAKTAFHQNQPNSLSNQFNTTSQNSINFSLNRLYKTIQNTQSSADKSIDRTCYQTIFKQENHGDTFNKFPGRPADKKQESSISITSPGILTNTKPGTSNNILNKDISEVFCSLQNKNIIKKSTRLHQNISLSGSITHSPTAANHQAYASTSLINTYFPLNNSNILSRIISSKNNKMLSKDITISAQNVEMDKITTSNAFETLIKNASHTNSEKGVLTQPHHSPSRHSASLKLLIRANGIMRDLQYENNRKSSTQTQGIEKTETGKLVNQVREKFSELQQTSNHNSKELLQAIRNLTDILGQSSQNNAVNVGPQHRPLNFLGPI